MGNGFGHHRVRPVCLQGLSNPSRLMPDSDALGVKLGHRRVSAPHRCFEQSSSRSTMIIIADLFWQVLQREIACSRGVPVDHVTSPHRPRPVEDGIGEGNGGESKSNTGIGGKRKYRRHPKVCYATCLNRGIRIAELVSCSPMSMPRKGHRRHTSYSQTVCFFLLHVVDGSTLTMTRNTWRIEA